MPGLFDSMRISVSGINTFRTLQEVVAQNIANAANKDYTRQQAKLTTLGSIWDGQNFLGQGVNVQDVIRVRDELLDHQIRNTHSASSKYDKMFDWLARIEATYNEPSEHGIASSLNNFWGAWQQLANDPQSQAARTSIINRTENLTQLINGLYTKLEDLELQVVNELEQTAAAVSSLTTEIAQLNQKIFEAEAGRKPQANDLRDSRDAALNKLSQLVEISFYEDNKGMVNVSISGHAAVIENKSEDLITRPSLLDASRIEVQWEYGEYFTPTQTGALAGVMEVRDSILADYKKNLDDFAGKLISDINSIYSQGVPLKGQVLMESNLGYGALGVNKSTDPLSLLQAGETRSLHISFYDEGKNVVRSHGILVNSTDSLSDIANKLNGIQGLNASLLSSTGEDGRLSLQLDTWSGANSLGETQFVISNNTGGYDTSGLLDMLGFSQTDKSTNNSATIPTLASRDLTELQTILGEPNVADVMNHALNLQGSFSINSFDTATETVGKTDGHMLQQLTVNVVETDTINTIMAKINNLTANYGVAISLNGGTNKLELTSTAQTDVNGDVVLAAGTDYMRLGFANSYRSPDVPSDTPPAGFTGTGDELGLFEKLQFNTLLTGSDARTISIDEKMRLIDSINAGFKLNAQDNSMVLGLVENLVTKDRKFTLSVDFANIIGNMGNDVQRHQQLALNEELLLENYITERDRISGVNMDEETANMMLFQRAYEANARMFSTLNQMAQEILQLSR